MDPQTQFSLNNLYSKARDLFGQGIQNVSQGIQNYFQPHGLISPTDPSSSTYKPSQFYQNMDTIAAPVINTASKLNNYLTNPNFNLFSNIASQYKPVPNTDLPSLATNAVMRGVIQPGAKVLDQAVPSLTKIVNSNTNRIIDQTKSNFIPEYNSQNKSFNEIQKYDTSQPSPGDYLNALGVIGLPKVAANMVGGGIGVASNAFSNSAANKPLFENAGNAYDQGFAFSSKLAGLGSVVNGISQTLAPVVMNNPVVQKIIQLPAIQKANQFLNPTEINSFNTWLGNVINKAHTAGTEMALFGALEDPKNGTTRLQNAWDQYKQGALFGGATAGVLTAPGAIKGEYFKTNEQLFSNFIDNALKEEKSVLNQLDTQPRQTTGEYANKIKTTRAIGSGDILNKQIPLLEVTMPNGQIYRLPPSKITPDIKPYITGPANASATLLYNQTFNGGFIKPSEFIPGQKDQTSTIIPAVPGEINVNPPEVLGSVKPKTDLLNQSQELRNQGNAELQINQSLAEMAKAERSLYAPNSLKDINRLRQMANSKTVQSGDVETLRTKNPKLVNAVAQSVMSAHPEITSEDAAIAHALENVPTQGGTRVKTPDQILQARKLENQAKNTQDQVFNAEPSTKTISQVDANNQQNSIDEWQQSYRDWTNTPKQNEKANLNKVTQGFSSSGPENQGPLPEQQPQTGMSRIKTVLKGTIQTSRGILNGMGEAGKDASRRIDEMYNRTERQVGNSVADYNAVTKGLDSTSLENVLKSLDGQQVSLTSKESQVAKSLRVLLDTYGKQAQDAGLSIKTPDGTKVPFTPRENYLPHVLDVEKLKLFPQETIDHLVQTGQFKSVESATQFVNDIISGHSIATAYAQQFPSVTPYRFGNLEAARLLNFPSDVLRYDKKLLPDYFSGAAQRIQQSIQFGADNEKLTPILQSIQRQGGDVAQAKNILERNLGLEKQDPFIHGASGALRQFQAITKLGLGAITNAGQSVNTATEFGIIPTIKNMLTAFKPENQDFALRSGAIVEDALKQISDESGVGQNKVLKAITAPGFGAVEKFNRVVAANTAKDFVIKRFNALLENPSDPVALKDLEKMGINALDALKRGSLTPEQIQKAAQWGVNTTQFKTRPIDLPPTWSSEGGKLVTQFKSFSYKHAQFVKDQVLAPALQGNLGPMTRYLILGLVVGEGIADVKAFVRNRQRPTNPAERALDNLSSVGGAGLAQDALQASQRGSNAVLQWIVGPTVSDIAKTAGNVGAAISGKPKALVKQAITSIPIVGQAASNTLFPPVGAYKSRTPDIQDPNDLIGVQSATLTPGTISDTKGNAVSAFDALSPTGSKQISDQIKAIETKKKEILNKQGFLGIGTPSDAEKNVQIEQLNAQEAEYRLLDNVQKVTSLSSSDVLSSADKQKKVYELLNTINNNDKLTQDRKNALISQLGISPQDAIYHQIASHSNETKSLYANEQITKLISSGAKAGDIYGWILDNMRRVNGQQVITPGVLDSLVNQNVISRNDAVALKKVVVTGLGATRKVSIPQTKLPKSVKIKKSLPKVPKVKMIKTKKIAKIKTKFKPISIRLKT